MLSIKRWKFDTKVNDTQRVKIKCEVLLLIEFENQYLIIATVDLPLKQTNDV